MAFEGVRFFKLSLFYHFECLIMPVFAFSCMVSLLMEAGEPNCNYLVSRELKWSQW